MFPGRGEHALQSALQQAEGDVSAAADLLIPPTAQVARDEALARSLQAAEMPPRGGGMGGMDGGGAGGDDSWGAVAQPIIDGLAAAADAAKGLVQYVAAEISAAVDAEPEEGPRRTAGSSGMGMGMPGRDERNRDEAAVVSGGASRGETGTTTMRTRAGRAAAAGGGRSAPKKDD